MAPRLTQRTRPLVLVAEDDDELRSLLVRCLERRGLDVIEAEDGFELEDSLRERDEPRPDVVVTDVRMPGRSGLEVLQRLGGHLASLVIVLSGAVDASLTDEALRLGITHVLAKPVDLDALAELVVSLCR